MLYASAEDSIKIYGNGRRVDDSRLYDSSVT